MFLSVRALLAVAVSVQLSVDGVPVQEENIILPKGKSWVCKGFPTDTGAVAQFEFRHTNHGGAMVSVTEGLESQLSCLRSLPVLRKIRALACLLSLFENTPSTKQKLLTCQTQRKSNGCVLVALRLVR